MGIILLVPLVYLVVALAAIQAGALGVEGAARQAARVAVLADDGGSPRAAVDRAVRVTLADYGIDAGAASVTMTCDRADCREAGARVSVSVLARVELPLVPDVLALTAVGTVVKAGSRVGFTEGVVTDESGAVVATATSTLLVFDLP